MPAVFFVFVCLGLWRRVIEKRDFDSECFGQVQRGVVEVVQVAVGLPEIEDVALGLAGRMEAAEDLAFEVGGEESAGGGGRFVDRERAAMLSSWQRLAADVFQDLLQWDALTQHGIVDRPTRAGRGCSVRLRRSVRLGRIRSYGFPKGSRRLGAYGFPKGSRGLGD